MKVGAFEAQHDLYAILGVTPTAGTPEIRRAYRRLAFLSHPDRQGTRSKMDVDLKLVNLAATVLLDPALRRRYDELRQRRPDVSMPVSSPIRDTARSHPVTSRRQSRPEAGGISFTTPTVAPVSAQSAWLGRFCAWAVAATMAFAVFNETFGPPRNDPYEAVRRLYRTRTPLAIQLDP